MVVDVVTNPSGVVPRQWVHSCEVSVFRVVDAVCIDCRTWFPVLVAFTCVPGTLESNAGGS